MLGSYIVGCLEHDEQTRCEGPNATTGVTKCYCSKNLCNSSDADTVINPLLVTVCVSLCLTIVRNKTNAYVS